MRARTRFSRPGRRGFTLVEMLVAMTVLAIMVGLIFTIGSDTNKMWTQANRRIEQFQSARNAFESLTRNLSQASLNTYYDYYDANGKRRDVTNGNFIPSTYGRATDLEFVSGLPGNAPNGATGLASGGATSASSKAAPGQFTHAVFFAAPLGYTQITDGSSPNYTFTENGQSSNLGGPLPPLDKLLCATGYYIQYSQAPSTPSFFSSADPNAQYYRFRLMQVLVPTEYFSLYSAFSNASNANASGGILSNSWIPGIWTSGNYSTGWVHQVASNIIALIISPEDPNYVAAGYTQQGPTYLAPNYNYDTSYNTGGIAGLTKPSFAQLPPVLHIAMVAIDEASALKLGNLSTPPTNLFQGAPFTDATKFETDLATLQANLSGTNGTNKIQMNCRIFDTRIALRESKFSSK
jgi:uncharacterized protein (TIGR02599 family)